jgi:RNA polymerase sigma factor (sigma-70 family)
MEVPDEELMLAYGGGDAGAFERLYARHRAKLFRFIVRSIPQRASAEELFQDIWIRVIEARQTYAPKARFTTWLYTIAHHRLVDHWRQRGLSLVAADEGETVPDLRNDPAARAEGRQALARLAQALERLPALQREAFLLHEEAGLSIAEIAAAMGCDDEAAKSRLRYATAKLKAAIDHG